MIQTLKEKLDQVTRQGFEPALQQLKAEKYDAANLILLQVINPLYNEIKKAAEAFLDIQTQEGKITFLPLNTRLTNLSGWSAYWVLLP